ncbi:N-acyl homoserine lactonase family protein [Thermorudis peleae]|uniref:N-acyl homoserine lactonase family protein n=1 Tax=Thermorudis peleae TaxID=1382356 RepID=UPI0005716160|nr:N-acyl homoserine lactonase family protein [Thermorudis peleae]MBX6754448.1 N-acyl homoserine lactonase family protein [Thermorudis peleae]
MKVFILDNGTLDLDYAWLYHIPHPATVDNQHPPAEWVTIPTYTVLIEHPQLGWVLYDATCHPEWEKRWPKELQPIFPYRATDRQLLPAQLDQLGLKMSDIDIIIISHLHLDHCGCLDFFRGTKAGSRGIIVHEDELAHALKVTHVGPVDFSGAYVKGEFELPGINYELMVGHHLELAPDLHLYHWPGHTPGLIGMVAHTQHSGTFIFTSDAIYLERNLKEWHLSGIVYDTVAYFRSMYEIKQLARKYNAVIGYGHDMDKFRELKKAPEYYE